MSQLDRTSPPPSPRQRPNLISGAILLSLVVVFLIAFGYTSYLFFQTTRAIILTAPQISRDEAVVASQEEGGSGLGSLPAEPSIPSGSNQANNNDLAQILAPIWDEQDPINILLLGIDQRPGQTGYYRTDTMILVNVDTNSGNVGMMSMPRDLWVSVPGFYEARINSAHVIGDVEDYPGGGPALAKETVSQLVGQPVHYYVRVNFEGFRSLLEEIGCIDIDVPRDIDDPLFPDDNFGYDPLFIAAGSYCMDADLALKYARTRHVDSDFGRMQRQQQVLLAMKDKVLDTGQLPQLIARLPNLLEALSASVQTDMPASQLITLANTFRKLNIDTIRRLVIDRSMVTSATRPSGAYVLMPNLEVLQPAIAAFFNPEIPVEPEVVDEIRTQIEQEGTAIAVLNGTTNSELGRLTAEWLAAQGFNVIGYADADRLDYTQTQIIDYGSGPVTLQRLVEMFGVIDENIRPGVNTGVESDLRLIIGTEFVLPAP